MDRVAGCVMMCVECMMSAKYIKMTGRGMMQSWLLVMGATCDEMRE